MSPQAIPKEPIAIVGSACQFAGDAYSPSKLWELLREPRDVRSKIPESRLGAKSFYHPNRAHYGYTNIKHFYLRNEDSSAFNAELFSINPLEKRAIYPQHQILIENIYEAVKSAGTIIERLRGSDTSIYAGVMVGD